MIWIDAGVLANPSPAASASLFLAKSQANPLRQKAAPKAVSRKLAVWQGQLRRQPNVPIILAKCIFLENIIVLDNGKYYLFLHFL
jgi:hypothetical protein